MKNRRLYAFGILVIITINFFWMASILSSLQMENQAKTEFNSSNSNPLQIQSNGGNFFATYANFKSQFAPLSIATFVGRNSINYDEDLVYLASIPIGLYTENGVLKVSPILYDDANLASEYLLKDWKEYCQKFGSWNGIKNIVYIGNISTATKTKVENWLNPEGKSDPFMTDPVQITGNTTYDLAANIASYFWYKADTVVIAPIDDQFPLSQTNTLKFNNTLDGIGLINKKGQISTSVLANYWSNGNVTLNAGGVFAGINETSKLVMELFGNFSKSSKWMYDTNKISNNNWVFFPNVSYPADMTDWGLKIYNKTPISSVSYNLTFYSLAYERHQFQITNSESQFDVSLSWANSADDLNFWVLDPSGQLLSASSRTGNLYQSGNTTKFSRFLYPETGTWTVLITRSTGFQPVAYNLTVNITTFSSYRRECIESAANGAVIASLLNKPLLYVSEGIIPNVIKNAISALGATKVVLVDPFNLTSSRGFFTALSALGVQLNKGVNLTSRTKVYSYIYNITHQSDIVITSVNEGYFASASLLAAYHGAPVLFSLNSTYNIHAGAIKNFAVDYWIGFQNPGDSALLRQGIPRFQDMKQVADTFYNWLNSLNLNKNGNETVLVVSPIWELNPFFDRALYGKALTGRFDAQSRGDLTAFIARNILYPALSYANLSLSYESQVKNVACEGNATKTAKTLYATSFLGTAANCQTNDGVLYHSYLNASKGQIVMAYYVNLSDFRILYNNITQVRISIDGKIGYSNNQIKIAGWAVWNWTAKNYKIIDNSVLNSTSDQSDDFVIGATNKSSFIYSQNARIEIFILVNTTGTSVRASIDYIAFTVTYNQPINYPKMVSTSVTYWQNFNYQGKSYNFSSLIPANFTQFGFQAKNVTGYQAVSSELMKNSKIWYYSGNSTLPSSEFGKAGNILFTQSNYWRAFGDYDDKLATPANPDADGDHFVTPNSTLAKWQTGVEFNASLSNLHSNFILLQDGFLGGTKVPQYLIQHGATNIVVDLKQNVLGYSEYFSYRMLNELLSNKPIGLALFKAYNQTSHLYARNWQGNVIGTAPFSNFTEENQQFILYGDPELRLINKTFDLPVPTSYRPLIHGFSPTVRRASPVSIWANITDLDSDLKTEVFGRFNVTNTDGNPFFTSYQTNVVAAYSDSTFLFMGTTSFFDLSQYPWETLGNKQVNWKIYDSKNEIQINVTIDLLTALPTIILSSSKTLINDNGTYNAIDHPLVLPDPTVHENLGRVNESLYTSFYIQDSDADPTKNDGTEFNVTLILNHVSSGANLSYPMTYRSDSNPTDAYSNWTYQYIFGAFNVTGQYRIYVRIKDGDSAVTYPYTGYDLEYPTNQFYQYVNLINWVPQKNGTNFLVTNATGPTHRVFRVNETVQVNASVFDVDGNQTRIKAASLCFKLGISGWVNISMSDPNLDNTWNATYRFTASNSIGVWGLYIKTTDKDNRVFLINGSTYLTVANIPPNIPFNLLIKNTSLLQTSTVFRNETIVFFANATDLDVSDRTTKLTLYACLKNPSGNVRYQYTMSYNTTAALWIYRFTPKINDTIGYWTYYVSVWDETGAYTNSTEKPTFRIKNNIPIIKTVAVFPSGQTLTIGETLSISGTASDVEKLAKIQIFITDSVGKSINSSQTLSGQSSSFNIGFLETQYSGLKQEGTWNITIKLFDADGNITNTFTFGAQHNIITIVVSPPSHEGENRFPYEIVIIVAIIVTTVLATYLVYRTRSKEATVIPATRVKQIIKKISKEKEEETERAQQEIKIRTKAIEVPQPVKGPIAPVVKPELTEEEKEGINKQLQDQVKTAQTLLDEDQFDKAALAYHDAAKLAIKLDKHEMARIYSDKGEEILKMKAELPRKKKAKEVEKKKKPEKLLGKAKIESIKAEIGETMRNARKVLREDDFMTAAKYYREVARLYRELFDEENARYFEAKADELL